MINRPAALLLWTMVLSAAGAAQLPEPERGAKIDVSEYAYRRAIEEGPAGLAVLTLDAAILAHSQGPAAHFADLRIVDDAGFQIPYVLERGGEPLSIDLQLETTSGTAGELARESRGNRTLYAVTLPYAPLPESSLVLETDDRVFRRRVRLGVERPANRRRDAWFDVLATAWWQHADPNTPAPALNLSFVSGDATALVLSVDEGDNQPLRISSVRLELPRWKVWFFRPSSERVDLVYGNDDARVPQYDLALLGPSVREAGAREIGLGPETVHQLQARELLPRWMFWSGLAIAALILSGLIVHLVRSGTPERPSPPGP